MRDEKGIVRRHSDGKYLVRLHDGNWNDGFGWGERKDAFVDEVPFLSACFMDVNKYEIVNV